MTTKTIEFTPSGLAMLVEKANRLRFMLIESVHEAGGADPQAEQHCLMAVGFIYQAELSLTLAKLAQSRALAGAR